MEDQLTALGERWAHICQWTDERYSKLKNLQLKWSQVMDECQIIQQWLDSKETQLKQMEANPLLEIGEVLDRIKKLQVSFRQYNYGLTMRHNISRWKPIHTLKLVNLLSNKEVEGPLATMYIAKCIEMLPLSPP
jgi:hypothetical protein